MRTLVVAIILLVAILVLVPGSDGWGRRRRRRPVNCGTNNWTRWSRCNAACSRGTQYRRRYVYRWPCCGGWGCPSRYTWRYCGSYNGGCQQRCTGSGYCSCYTGYYKSGSRCYDVNECTRRPCDHNCHNNVGSYTCSCNTGYYLSSRTKCYRVSCGNPRIPNCPSSSYRDSFGSACQKITIPSCGKLYRDYCYPRCSSSYYKPATYSGGGTFMASYSRTRFESLSRIQCQANKQWTDASLLSRLYCRRVNDPPTSLRMSSYSLNENSAVGTTVGYLSTSDPQSSQRHTYTMQTGTTNTGYYLFRLSGNRVISRWVPKLNVPGGIVHSSFKITVRATDNGLPNMYKNQQFTVNIINVNDPPQDIKLSPWQVKESVAINTRVGYLSAYDPDVPTDKNPCSQWILRDSDNGFFKLSGNQVLVAKTLNHEAQNYHSIVVICTDKQRGSVSTSQSLVVDVQDAKDPPISITMDKTKVDENSKVGTLVGMVTAIDEDDEKLTISMYPTSSIFSLSSTSCKDVQTATHIHRQSCTAQVMVKSAKLNWELQSWYSVTLYARDSSPSHLHKVLVVNITLNNLNEQPTAITLGTPSIPENSPGGSLVSDLDVSDPDNEVQLVQRPTCVLGAGGDNAKFEINGQSPNYDLALAKDTVLDYEKKKSYSITITCNDHGLPDLSITRSFTIAVTDENEAPDGISLSTGSVPENVPIGTVVGTLSTSDPDTTPQTFVYALLPTGGNDLPFKITGNKLIVNDSIDYETVEAYTLSISVDDQGGLEFIDQIDLNVTDVPEGPTSVTLDGAHELPENSGEGTLVGNIIVTDQDFNQLPTCAVAKDYSNGALEVAGTGGDELVAGKRMVDFETQGATPLKIDIKCTDTTGLSKTSTFSIKITDVNEAPTNITLSANTIPEGVAPYTVGQLTVIDPDAAQTHNCSIQDNDGAAAAGQIPESQIFKVTKSLQLQVIKPLDYENGLHTYSVHVLCSDIPINPNQTSYVIEEDLTVQVVNVNEPPQSPCVGTHWTISEMAQNGASVTGPLAANDTEDYQVLSFSLKNAGSVPFYINSSNDAIFTTGNLDFEKTKYYDLQITVTDDGSLTQVAGSAATKSTPASATFTCRVNVLDANDPHSSLDIFSTPMNPCVDEHMPGGTLIATFSTSDVDANANFTYKVAPAYGPFEMMGNKLVAKSGVEDQVDWESGTTSLVLTITSTDNHGYSVDRPITVCIRNVNENATKMCLVGNTIKENIPGVATIGQIVVQDPDLPIRTCGPPPAPHNELPNNYTCIIDDGTTTGVYSDYFSISPTLELEQTKALDYEAGATYHIPVLCRDILAPFNVISTRFTVNILDVNEAPENIAPLSSGQNMPYNATKTQITVSVPERQSGITLLTLTCDDPDYPGASPHVKYTASGNGVPSLMEMQNNQLVLLKAFDFETQKQYVLNVQVTDDGRPPPALTTSIKVVINVADTNDLPTQINLVCKNGALFPFANTTTRPMSSPSMMTKSANITVPVWPSRIVTHPGIPNTAEDCSVITSGMTIPGSIIGEVYPEDQDAQKWYTFMLLGKDAQYFTLYPYGSMLMNKYSHSALVLLRTDVDMYNMTLGNPTYDIYVDVYDNYGQQQVGHIVHIRTEDACVASASQCLQQGTCMPSMTLGQVTCGCPTGSFGDGRLTSVGGTGCKACKAGELPDAAGNCQQVNECASNPCKQGVCVDGVFSFTCTCPSGFTGTLCETNLEGCALNKGVCQNNGDCVDTKGALTCMCKTGFTGAHCEYYTAACTSFPSTCEDKSAKFCALTPHVGTLESTPLCVTNTDMIHAIITGVPEGLSTKTQQFTHVCSGYLDEILANEAFPQDFNAYATAQLSLGSRKRRSTQYTQLAMKPYLSQVINITVLKSDTILVSFSVLSAAQSYHLSHMTTICKKLVSFKDVHCANFNDCVLLQTVNFGCSPVPYEQLLENQKEIFDALHYIQSYSPETKAAPCIEGRADCNPVEPPPEAQVESSKSPFWKTTTGISIIAVCAVTVLVVAIIVVYFMSGKQKIKSRYEDRRLMDDADTVSTHSGVSGNYPSIQQSGRNFQGVKNPLFEGQAAATETKENAMYDSAGGDLVMDNAMYEAGDGQEQLYEELPN